MLPDREEIADRKGRIKAYEAAIIWIEYGYSREQLKEQLKARIKSNQQRIRKLENQMWTDEYPPF